MNKSFEKEKTKLEKDVRSKVTEEELKIRKDSEEKLNTKYNDMKKKVKIVLLFLKIFYVTTHLINKKTKFR